MRRSLELFLILPMDLLPHTVASVKGTSGSSVGPDVDELPKRFR